MSPLRSFFFNPSFLYDCTHNTCLFILETTPCYRGSTNPFAFHFDLDPFIMFLLLVNISLSAPVMGE